MEGERVISDGLRGARMVEGGSGREVGRKGGKSGGDRDRTAGVTDAAAEEEEDMDGRKDGGSAMLILCYKTQQYIVYPMERWDISRNRIV